MAWLMRFYRAIVDALLRRQRDDGWVEPSNAITRVVLAAPSSIALPPIEPPVRRQRRTASIIALNARQQPVTRTAQRARRRRANRAA
ncbi:MAG: hypothetical protein KatS3mg063_1485 [Tepidiforma sp.]|jgi:hypothetical protein|uniref:Transposase n=1 Tax=Tepidiforma bonchosmolovskayae TaxID=2601677 RepID=A0ABX6BYB4_9CHLR|nr:MULTISPECIES: hypothetical protein [Tepidiforma]QFG01822.1 hypothetical protein Tbon_00325 [Tepidiforma bonchosmolovskayae]GIW15632.1 MAG: hypothetical protein KatS3mg063_1485 [Tepidiforma sp.]